MLNQWRDLIRQSYQELRSFFENSAIPNILEHYDFIKSNSEGIREIIKWQYVNQVQEGDTNGLLLNLLKSASNLAIQRLGLEKDSFNHSVGRQSKNSYRQCPGGPFQSASNLAIQRLGLEKDSFNHSVGRQSKNSYRQCPGGPFQSASNLAIQRLGLEKDSFNHSVGRMSNRAIKHLVIERGPLNTSVGRPTTSSCRYHGSGWLRLHFNETLLHFERKMSVQRPNQYTEHGQTSPKGFPATLPVGSVAPHSATTDTHRDRKLFARYGVKSTSVIPGTQAPEKLAPALPCQPALHYLRKKPSTGTGWREELAPPSDHPITRKSGAHSPNSRLLRPSLICPRTIIETNYPELPSGDLKEVP
uniref:(California timema) hypothetical protein n=1 Tax=Timema californicum TaxID=61474 RepID=A0A7R9PDC2_TIMCA|nr:unnamed protein product [Timema californicum]